MSEKASFIAEIGENHIGNPDLARAMLIAAARAGADIVKFQSYRATDVDPADPERDWFARVELSDELHAELQHLAQEENVGFMSSPFSVERARLLCERLGCRRIKIASSELLHGPLLDYVDTHAEEVFLSTGMATVEEIRQALSHLTRVRKIWILHCVTQYPAQDEEANLRALTTLKQAFPQHGIGYSDHTVGIDAAIAAVALGARVIEKHFTLSKGLPGTDHILSATPDEFAEMVRRVRRLELMLGREGKGPVEREMRIRDQVRRRWQGEGASR